MEGQRTTDDAEAPPPRAALAAARRAEIEDARHGNEEDRQARSSIFPGVLVIILAALSALAVWMAT
jgi:hypothetical protein